MMKVVLVYGIVNLYTTGESTRWSSEKQEVAPDASLPEQAGLLICTGEQSEPVPAPSVMMKTTLQSMKRRFWSVLLMVKASL